MSIYITDTHYFSVRAVSIFASMNPFFAQII